MDNQEIFNTVVRGLREQGCKAGRVNVSGEYDCMYRDLDGNKCAVGQIIPDELYSKSMEGSTFVYANERTKPIELFTEVVDELGLTGENLILLSHLQHIHDDHEVEEWEEQWTMLAKSFNLKMPVALLEEK